MVRVDDTARAEWLAEQHVSERPACTRVVVRDGDRGEAEIVTGESPQWVTEVFADGR